MAESSMIVALRLKRAEIEKTIIFMEGKLAEMRSNLVHVVAVQRLYEGGDEPGSPAGYRMHLARVFAPGEYLSLSLAILREHGAPMNTAELAMVIIKQRGWSADDLVLRRSLIRRISEMLSKAHRRGKIGSDGMVRNVRVWRLP